MPEVAAVSPVSGRTAGRAALWAVALFVLALLLVFHQTAWSMVAIWLRSETFAHGFLILPISVGLAWNSRERLRQLAPAPLPWLALLILPIGFVWLLATLVHVLVIQQLALVAMLVVGIWSVLGQQLALALAFPLLFLFFAVPMGEALVPPMMEFTATSTVWLIQLTGIPVFREGLYFSLPSGNWSVIEACSGVRYMIASITLGVLYAYLTYRSAWRRSVFVLVSVIVPIIANTIRAYIIVMLGHLSNMTVATGVDHLIYGWIFFGLVMFLLFWVGSFFREDGDGSAPEYTGPSVPVARPAATPAGIVATALFALLLGSLWPWLAAASEARVASAPPVAVTLPGASGSWTEGSAAGLQWQPGSAVGGETAAFYAMNGHTVGLYLQFRDGTVAGGELVGSNTRFVENGDNQRVVGTDSLVVQVGGQAVLVDEAQVRNINGEFLAWSWYRVDDRYTSNDYVAKFREAWASLGAGSVRSYRIIVAVPMEASAGEGRQLLARFLDDYGSQLDAALNRAATGVN